MPILHLARGRADIPDLLAEVRFSCHSDSRFDVGQS